MPFVVCASNGGPLDDHAFVCGARFQTIHHALLTVAQFGIVFYEHYVESDLVPQLDLLAMHLGWTLTSTPWDEHPDEWCHVSFEKNAEPAVGLGSPEGTAP